MNLHRSLFLALVPVFIFLLAGCPFQDPAKGNGIRIITQEELAGIGNSDFRVPGVIYSGSSQGTPGTGNTGNTGYISGVTGSHGIADNPNAYTDVEWSVDAEFGVVLPECPPAQGVFYVPPSGDTVTATCYFYE